MYEGILLEFEIEPHIRGQQIFLVECQTYHEFAEISQNLESALKARDIKVSKCWRMPIRPVNKENFDHEFERLLKDAIFCWTDGGSKFGNWLERQRLWRKCKLLGEIPMP